MHVNTGCKKNSQESTFVKLQCKTLQLEDPFLKSQIYDQYLKHFFPDFYSPGLLTGVSRLAGVLC